MATNAIAQTGSQRWTHFYSALQLAIQRAGHKWTYEDFAECFPLWCDEQPEGAEAVFGTVSRFVESQITTQCNELFATYDVKNNVDKLHEVVTEARARKRRGETGKDVWREDLDPRSAVRARVVPVLEAERDRLKDQLAKMRKQNLELQKTVLTHAKERKEVDEKTAEILEFIDEVYAKWKELPTVDIGNWALIKAEAQNSTIPLS
ncbi:hypothetical protein EVG20_g4757 [Dentipellis fragilis]|uniref:Uncharacterized protein n=1 Tax=Dentipellis fragilis TaxID=205917 RepID=A0A4Y9YYX4_9AGAM|nr:hypothetical protein EVG20_g4757 [Dentipellis fragilis]